jgi:hypothetical protein
VQALCARPERASTGIGSAERETRIHFKEIVHAREVRGAEMRTPPKGWLVPNAARKAADAAGCSVETYLTLRRLGFDVTLRSYPESGEVEVDDENGRPLVIDTANHILVIIC